jgi:hypothetical protein
VPLTSEQQQLCAEVWNVQGNPKWDALSESRRAELLACAEPVFAGRNPLRPFAAAVEEALLEQKRVETASTTKET